MLPTHACSSLRDLQQHMSFYVDWGGGPGRNALICDTVRVVRVESDIAEFAFIDSTNTPLQHEHHLIMKADTAGMLIGLRPLVASVHAYVNTLPAMLVLIEGLYGYNIMTAVAPITISEVRMNVRFNRCIMNHAYNFERGDDKKQPTCVVVCC